MPPVVIDLTELSPSQGFIIQGDAAGDSAGWSVSDAGDVNGDGIGDLIVGAPKGDDGGANAGEAYVIYGRVGTTRPRLDLTNLTAADGFIIRSGAAANYAGLSVSGAGDINGDGIDDLIVGAPYNSDGGTAAGAAYVIYGKSGITRSTVDLTSLSLGDGFVIQGDASGDLTGFSVSDAGDVNGDGIDDVVVGANYGDHDGVEGGEVFVIYGRMGNARGRLDLTSLTANDGFVVRGAASGDVLGRSVSGAGDVNGDGIGDLVIGARDADSGGYSAGEAYVIYGQTGATRTSISLSNLAASDGFAIQGDEEYDEAGFSVSNAGDVNGDGIDDFAVGARYGGFYGRYAGETYVVYGRVGAERGRIDLTNFTTNDGFIILGEDTFHQAGRSIGSAGDVNGDGIDDLIVGVPFSYDGGNNAGKAYVVYGKAGPRGLLDLIDFTAEDGFIIKRNVADDFAGFSVSGAGDVNGDGLDDVIVGGRGNDNGGAYAGEAYVVYGSLEAGAIGGTGADNLLTGTTAADAIYGLAGDDVVFGAGGDDRLFGADGSDGLFGEAGNDTLYGGADQDKVDGGADNDSVSGGAEGDSLRGGDGDDVLDGGAGSDAMNGGTGIDIFTGGEGRDKFRFGDGDTGNSIATADRITDFEQAQGERISLTAMDAIVGGADDAFTFIGTAAFGNVAGELRYELIGGNTYVMGDTNGDGASDFMIRVDGALVLTGADFSL